LRSWEPLSFAPTRDDHAACLGHWLNVLREDKRAIFSAAAHAQHAADYLNGLQPDSAPALAQQHEQQTAAA
jgi:antirestriction protein ArdC